ncbi:hypothetical protein QFZ37_000001, partial [Chryseobacterium ginsenosidimutans]|nr:hypothetical protein [Chryseobacterium ginsenosidimutans]
KVILYTQYFQIYLTRNTKQNANCGKVYNLII